MIDSDADRALTFDQILIALRRSWWILAVGLIAGAGVAYAIARTSPKRYTATSSLLFNVSPALAQLSGSTSSPDTSPSQGVQDTNVSLVRLGTKGAPALATARLVGHGLTRSAIAGSLAIAPESDTEIVSVSATSGSPRLARQIANTYTRQFIVDQRRLAKASYRSALAAVDRQLAALPSAQQTGAAGLVLQQRAQSLAAVAQLDDGGIQVAQPATSPTSPSSPDTKLDVVLGVILGLVIALIVVLLRERLDRRIRTPEQLEAIYGRPVIGAIPDDAGVAIRPAIPSGSGWSEAFQRLRTRLRYFDVDRDLRTIVVTSALPGDGKTTVAYNLAVAATRAGTSTLLIEADLRQPDLAARLGLESDPGFASVLVRGCAFEEAIQSMALRVDQRGQLGGLLDVIPAGSVPPPNPSELLESRAMDALLGKARDAYGLVIIDTPALGAVSDAIPLLTRADGVIVVSELRGGRTDVAVGIRDTLAGVGAPVLGVVANRVRRRASPSYGPVDRGDAAAVPLRSMNGHEAAVRAGVAAEAAEASEEGWQ